MLRRSPSTATSKPEERIFEQNVLLWIGEDLVTMSHVHVDHAVLGIRPDYGDISAGQRVLEP